MCGIYGVLSRPYRDDARAPTAFFDRLESLVEIAPGDARLTASEALELVEAARADCYRFVERDGFLHVLTDKALRDRLSGALARIAGWVGSLESWVAEGRFEGQSEAEHVNRLIVCGRDLAWQLERDVLDKVDPVRRLVSPGAGDAAPIAALAHAWSLNLVLGNIDRLEVRGRDSAGLGVFVRFPDARALEAFEAELAQEKLGEEYAHRLEFDAGNGRAMARPATSDRALLFTYKVANEVGEMGDNVRALREAVASDRIFQKALRAPDVEIQVLAHTRWASNGIVSVPNCHPVESSVYRGEDAVPGSVGALVAVLNGDIDNYQDLYREYVVDRGLRIDERVTTDAKIIPVVIGHHYRETGDLEAAFRKAFDVFEGSMAIGLMAADRPGEFLFAQKGSGQGMFLGFAEGTTCIASEMYALVELTQSYAKAEGEQVEGGEVFHLERESDGIGVSLIDAQGVRPLPRDRVRKAEITTRDINRGSFPRFFLKEISESVETVRKTLRGKYEITDDGEVLFHLGPEVLDPQRLEAFKAGAIRRIYTIGQGTASIAGDGIAALLGAALQDAPFTVQVQSFKATELSGHHLRDDMSDTLVIAVSQSGTTTDTNRTVDMARERGAWILGIVNRRNSDLVYKSHGVLYTSDGRDIEMSVASTKAFYAQNVCGQILALALAAEVGALSGRPLRKEVRALDALPDAMERTLALGDEVQRLAQGFAPRRKHWALVGSGFEKISANEIRIKLSELCYKSIACDFTEDKKHIDLSSEPLIILCAACTPASTVSDVVKEAAIFKAHQSIPIVITSEGETRFDPYAAGVIKVPVFESALGFLLSTMVGHLFGYHAAASFDRLADRLRAIRTTAVRELEPAQRIAGGAAAADVTLSDGLLAQVREFQSLLWAGALNGCLTPASAVRLSTVFHVALGRAPELALGGGSLLDAFVSTLSSAINELSRPIDAIKHQAKTVTVGISRGAEAEPQGVLLAALAEFGVDLEGLSEMHRRFLAAFSPLVASVEGSTVYRVEGLDAVGRPRDDSIVSVLEKFGCAASMYSRCEGHAPLAGTKWGVVKSRELYLGYGRTDNRKILIVPLVGEDTHGHVVLFHIELQPRSEPAARMRALATHRARFEAIRIAVTERNQDWDPSLLDQLDNVTLFFEDPDRIAEEIASGINASG